MNVLIAALTGAVLATLATFSLVQAMNSEPEPVSQPLVVYGER